MNPLTTFAQAATYNCEGATDSSYGAGNYNECMTSSTSGGTPSEGGTTTQPGVGAPNTGDFMGFITTGGFGIVLPLLLAIVIVSVASIAVIRKKKTQK